MDIDLRDERLPVALRLTWRALGKYLDVEWRAQNQLEGIGPEDVEWSLDEIENYAMTPIYRTPIDSALKPEPNSFILYRTVVLHACGHDVVTVSLQGSEIPNRRHTWHFQYGLICPQRSLWKPTLLWLPWDKIYI